MNPFQQKLYKVSKRSQRGFSLVELSIVLIIMAMVIMTMIELQTQEAQTNKAKAVAQIYTRINNAAGSYLTNFYDRLITLKPECGFPAWGAPGGGNVPKVDQTGCGVTLQLNNGPKFQVANGLQPTPAELTSLGLLESGGNYNNALPLPTIWDGVGGNVWLTGNLGGIGWVMGVNGTALPNRFMVLIQFVCITPNGATAAFTRTGACTSNTFDLRSLVFNSQPYMFSNDQLSTSVLDQAQKFAGSDAYLSSNMPNDNGDLRTMYGSAEATLPNPSGSYSGHWAGNWQAAPNILAMRNGYGSAGWDRYVRRDGSTPMTSNWDYGNHNVTNINNIGVNGTATIGIESPITNNLKPTLTVNGASVVTGDSLVKGDSTVGGNLTAETGIFGTIKNAVSAALQTASAYVEGLLTVGGNTQLNGDLSVKGKTTLYGYTWIDGLSVTNDLTVGGGVKVSKDLTVSGLVSAQNGIVMNKYAVVGTPCDYSKETFALQAWDSNGPYSGGLRMVVCSNDGTKVWQYPMKNQQSSLDSVIASINDLSNRKTGVTYQALYVNNGGPVDIWSGNTQYFTKTNWACDAWSQPVLSEANGFDGNGFTTDTECVNGVWWLNIWNPRSCIGGGCGGGIFVTFATK